MAPGCGRQSGVVGLSRMVLQAEAALLLRFGFC